MRRIITSAVVLLAWMFLGSAGAAVVALECEKTYPIPNALHDSGIVIFGEIHGTEQIPKAVGSFVCAKLQKGSGVALILEISANEQEAIDRYIDSNGDAADKAALVAGRFWTRPRINKSSSQDGRASVAMFQLIEEARRHRKEGRQIEVIAAAAYAKGHDMDEMLAKAIRQAHSTEPTSAIVALMGGNHASGARGRPWDPEFEGAGYRLRDLKPALVDTIYAGGSAWICRQEGCGQLDLWRDLRAENREVGYGAANRDGFSWNLMLGKVTASPPVVPE
jgi:hypothetical protein